MKRIVQIAAAGEDKVYALTEDGVVWMMNGFETTRMARWQKLPVVPTYKGNNSQGGFATYDIKKQETVSPRP